MCWRTREGRKAQGLGQGQGCVERRGSQNRDDGAPTSGPEIPGVGTEEDYARDTRKEPQLLETLNWLEAVLQAGMGSLFLWQFLPEPAAWWQMNPRLPIPDAKTCLLSQPLSTIQGLPWEPS